MEIQERNGFSIVGFIAQILVILIFVFVLMWLFPTKSYLENNGTAGAGTGSNSALSELLFNQNLLSMKDAAKEYFTVKRMPSTNGSSKKLTLDEMINKSMVVEFIDANGKKCDRDASYVKVTKVDKEYEMEVSLTCGKVTKTIKTTIGCYNYCESGMCEKEEQITLYQYAKKTEGTSKWSNWSEWSKTEVEKTSTREVEKKVVNEKTGTKTTTTGAIATTTYSCPEGYSISDDKKSCVKPTSTTETIGATATTTYSCPDSTYSISTDKKTCTKKTSSTSTVNSVATTTYSCPDSTYSLSTDKKTCTKKDTVYAGLQTVYSCSKGKLSGDKCIITDTTSAIPHMKFTFDCTSGICQSVSSVDYYYCSDSSYKVSGKQCVKTTTVAATSSKVCPANYSKTSDGTQCYKTTTSTVSSTATTKYSCSDSTYSLSSDKKTCSKTTSSTTTKASTATTTYSCPANYTKTADGKNCFKTTSGTSTIASTGNTKYSCATGKLNNENKCDVTVDVYGNVTYYRYRTLTKTSATTVYKWSTSSNDQSLIKAGYKYTGVTKTKTSK